MNTLFQHLARALNTADALTLRVQAVDGGKLRLMLIPELKGEAPTEGKDAELRAALAVPLVMTDDPARLDEGFVDMVREYAQQRAALRQSLGVIESLKKANTKAAAKASQPATKAKAAPKQAAGAETPAPAPAPATDEDILL